jgi:hypothetical protein
MVLVVHPVPDPVPYLAGRWRLVRQITDLSTGLAGRFLGTAEFRKFGDGLHYRESGELEFGGHRGPAWRELRYRRAGPTGLRVEFDDGRFFHDLDLASGRCQVSHPCRADMYEGEFRVLGADRWRQDWQVTGPAKEQWLRTSFDRIRARGVGVTTQAVGTRGLQS